MPGSVLVIYPRIAVWRYPSTGGSLPGAPVLYDDSDPARHKLPELRKKTRIALDKRAAKD